MRETSLIKEYLESKLNAWVNKLYAKDPGLRWNGSTKGSCSCQKKTKKPNFPETPSSTAYAKMSNTAALCSKFLDSERGRGDYSVGGKGGSGYQVGRRRGMA